MTVRNHPQVTHEKIVELIALGMTSTQIAERLQCCVGTIFYRLRVARKADPKVARQDRTERLCKCGRSKQPRYTKCSRCRYGKPCQPKKDWNSGDAVQGSLPLKEEQPQAAGRPEENTPCRCGKRIKSATAQACVVCEGTGEKLDRLMAANRGISVEELRSELRCQKYGQKRQGAAA